MDTPVTRAELESLLTRHAERIEGHTDAELRNVTEQLRTDMKRIETSLLTEFHQWARTHELRERGSLSLLATFDEPPASYRRSRRRD
jgi:hypothetical protein